MLQFKVFFESVDLSNELDQKVRTFFWRKNRGWKKLLNTEPYISLANIYQLLVPTSETDWATKYNRNSLIGVVLPLLVVDMFGDQFAHIPSVANLKQTVADIVKKPVTTPEEANALVKEMRSLNSPVHAAISMLWCVDMMRMPPFSI